MRIKNLVLSLAVGLAVAAVGAGTIAIHESGAPLIAEAAQPEGWSYVITGSMNGWSAAVGEDKKLHTSDPSYEFHYVENGDQVEGQTEYWEVTFFASANDMFKIATYGPGYAEKWEMKYDECGIDGKSEYFTSEAGGAVVVTASGNYTIRLASTFAADYGDKSYGIWVTSDVEQVDVIYHYDEGVTVSDKATVGVSYIPSFKFVDGYYVRGFYTDGTLETVWPEEGVVPTAGEALNVYVKTEVCPEDADYYIYIEAWTDNPYKYVYLWNDSDVNNVWPGAEAEVAPISYVTDELVTLYRYLVPAEYEASFLILNNGGGEQTKTITLSGSNVYASGTDIEGPVTDSADKLVAIAFLEHYETLRTTHAWGGETLENSICWIIEDAEEWATLKDLYEAITNKALVDSIEDGENNTIGDTMTYLYSRIDGTGNGSAPILFGNDDNNAMIIGLSVVCGLFLLVTFSVLYFNKRKRVR